MSALSVFSFSEKLPVRVSIVNDEPWFVAKDIAQCLEYTQASIASSNKLFGAVPDQWKDFQEFETRGGKQRILALSEQGLYFFLGRSDKPKALPFQMWLAGEVLPSIRKTGQYSTCSKTEQVATLSPAQQLLVQQAVGRRAKRTASHYQTIYRAIKLRFQIAKYDQLPQSQLNECLTFINEVDLRVPEAQKCEPEKALPTKPRVTYTVTADFLEKQRTFVYCIRYLFRDPLMQAMRVMQALNVPNANMLWDVVHDFNLAELESNLDRLGYPVKELECYKHLMRIKK